MRELASEIITTAAINAGMPGANIIDKPVKQSMLLPVPRIEIGLLDENIISKPRRIARFPSVNNPGTHVVCRWRTHVLSITVRAAIHSDNEAWLSHFYKQFVVGLPRKGVDTDNNLVTVSVSKARFGGFESRLVEVIKKREIPVWVTITGGLYRDDEIPLIRSVNVRDGVIINP